MSVWAIFKCLLLKIEGCHFSGKCILSGLPSLHTQVSLNLPYWVFLPNIRYHPNSRAPASSSPYWCGLLAHDPGQTERRHSSLWSCSLSLGAHSLLPVTHISLVCSPFLCVLLHGCFAYSQVRASSVHLETPCLGSLLVFLDLSIP